jgi:hypothetical protein
VKTVTFFSALIKGTGVLEFHEHLWGGWGVSGSLRTTALKEEHRLRVSEIRVLRRLLGLKREEVTGG